MADALPKVIIKSYTVLVKEGRLTAGGVPERYREAVGAALKEEGVELDT